MGLGVDHLTIETVRIGGRRQSPYHATELVSRSEIAKRYSGTEYPLRSKNRKSVATQWPDDQSAKSRDVTGQEREGGKEKQRASPSMAGGVFLVAVEGTIRSSEYFGTNSRRNTLI